jgi:hypothetical protein
MLLRVQFEQAELGWGDLRNRELTPGVGRNELLSEGCAAGKTGIGSDLPDAVEAKLL